VRSPAQQAHTASLSRKEFGKNTGKRVGASRVSPEKQADQARAEEIRAHQAQLKADFIARNARRAL
jgi:hypothetical protein